MPAATHIARTALVRTLAYYAVASAALLALLLAGRPALPEAPGGGRLAPVQLPPGQVSEGVTGRLTGPAVP